MRFRTPEEIRHHLSTQRTSGLSVSAYCNREGISQNTFFNWRKRERDIPTPPISFLQLPDQSAAHQKFKITLPNGSRCTMPHPCDPVFLRQTIRMLSGLRPR
jgi:transposase-like protein